MKKLTRLQKNLSNKKWRTLIKSSKRTGRDGQKKMFEKRQRAWLDLESGREMVRNKPDIRRYTSAESLPPRQQVVVSGLRMGYTNMTHLYRLESNSPPFCEECSTTATIDHILCNCSVFNAARDRNEINSDIMKNEVNVGRTRHEACSYLERNWCIRAHLKNRGAKNRRRMEGFFFF
jgi:hypothetical protein